MVLLIVFVLLILTTDIVDNNNDSDWLLVFGIVVSVIELVLWLKCSDTVS